MSALRRLLKVATTVFLLLVTLGLGSIGLCAAKGLPQVIHAPFYLVAALLVVAVALAGIHVSIAHIRQLWAGCAEEPPDGA